MDQAKLILLGKTTGLYAIGKHTGSCFQGEASMIVRKTRSRSRAERASGPMVERIASRPGSVVSTSCRGRESLSIYVILFGMSAQAVHTKSGVLPWEGLSPYIPQQKAGVRILPPMLFAQRLKAQYQSCSRDRASALHSLGP
jgi:hypothetical protein